MHQGCVFFNQYLVVRFLGKGACGKVYLVLDTLDARLYALKITHKADMKTDASSKPVAKGGAAQGDGAGADLTKPNSASPSPIKSGAKPEKDPLEDLRAEVAIMGRVSHPNVVVLKEVVEDPLRNKARKG